jgi:uncharacterized membrane protein YdbT with pleckstrin-like domain
MSAFNAYLLPNERVIMEHGFSGVAAVGSGRQNALVQALWSRYCITTERLLLLSGLLSKEVSDHPIRDITSVRLQQSLGGRLIGYGTLHIQFSRFGTEVLTLEGIEHAARATQALNYIAQRLRARHPHAHF